MDNLLKLSTCIYYSAAIGTDQFLKLWTGAGILPPLPTNLSQLNLLTGIIGAWGNHVETY